TNGPNPAFIAGACLFWVAFVCARTYRDRQALRNWGFRSDNLAQASAAPAAVFFVIALAVAAYAHRHGQLRFRAPRLVLFLLCPVWGVIQQFLALGVVVGSLERVPWLGRNRAVLVLVGASVFGLVHADDPRVAAGTFLLELVAIPLYLR